MQAGTSGTGGTGRGSGPAAGPWAPLAVPVYRALWIAVLVSNIGTWMQTVGAQWLLVDEPNASTLVALVQTASTLPVVALALPAGVLADSFDRRRLLLGVQAFQVVVGAILTALTAAGQMRPALLLTLTFALGAGAAVTAPAYQALIPELVPRSQITSASALGSISVNLARAVGPAVAGLLISHVGVAAVFALNAVTFAVFGAVLLAWRRPVDDPREREPFAFALRAGGRYVRHSPVVRRLLLRVLLFVVPAMAVWALLPLVATRRLDLGASGYGVLLGALGVGAVGGAFLLPRARARLSANALVAVASCLYALGLAVVVAADVLPLVLLALLPAGAGWIGVLSTMNASLQLFLPNWVRARGLAVYQVVLFGGQAVGAFGWGLVADHLGLRTAYLAAAAGMAVGAASIAVWPLRDTRGLDRSPAVFWPEPELAFEPAPDDGPVLVTRAYTVAEQDEEEFLEAMERVRRATQRTGAVRWQVYRDGADPRRFLEAYVVPSWAEHLRQHEGRLTGSDRVAEERANALSSPPPVVSHLFPAGRAH
ncbi:MFS transporter [Motilibacter sp. K478]|nr:MFS transporter [Motilibacter aurantiacus]NHC44466.1 MFS transporter [Motilibacter aurantiacus]